MAVQNNIAAGYLTAFEGPIGVSVQAKLTKWPFLQELGFAGSLSYAKTTFHGLKDFNEQMEMYSNTHPLLRIAWSVIKPIAPLNSSVLEMMFPSSILGMVGNEFQSLTGFGEAFAISPDQLKSTSTIDSQVASASPASTLQIRMAGVL